MPTNIGAVFIGVNSGGDPGVSRPCYAAWWPGDCSGSGREGKGWRPVLFCGLEGQWSIGLPPLSPCYGRSGSGRRKHTREYPRMQFESDDWKDFQSLTTLGRKAGVAQDKLAMVVAKELTDNALDAAGAAAVGLVAGNGFYVADDGPGIAGDDRAIASL